MSTIDALSREREEFLGQLKQAQRGADAARAELEACKKELLQTTRHVTEIMGEKVGILFLFTCRLFYSEFRM
jgi:hypothetical protein